MKKLSIILIAVLLLTTIPAPASAQMQSYVGIGVYFSCASGAAPGGTAAIGAQWSAVNRRNGFAYFVVPPGTYSIYYNGAYAGSIRADRNKSIRRLVSC